MKSHFIVSVLSLIFCNSALGVSVLEAPGCESLVAGTAVPLHSTVVLGELAVAAEFEKSLGRHIADNPADPILAKYWKASQESAKAPEPEKKKLTSSELEAISFYVQNGFWDMNRVLRGFETDPYYAEKVRKPVQALISALNKIADFDGLVFRGTWLPQAELDQYLKKGSVVTDLAFMSASAKYRYAHHMPRTDSRSILMAIRSKTGKEIAPYRGGGHAIREVVFAPGKSFKVDLVLQRDDGVSWLVFLDEVDSAAI